MRDNVLKVDERRKIIISGIKQNHSITRIAAELGVRQWMVLNDIRAMRHADDQELKRAYQEKEERTRITAQSKINRSNERFLKMTGMTFKEKNFLNMLSYYRAELNSVRRHKDEHRAITSLSIDIRKTLSRNGVIEKHGNRVRLTGRARDLLGLD